MEPIISPWIIYLLSFVSKLQGVLFVLATMCGLGVVIHIITVVWKAALETGDRDYKMVSRMAAKLKLFSIFFVIIVVSLVIIPSKNTLIGMMIAKNVTSVNIEKALETGKNFKDEIKKDVIEIIDHITQVTQEKKGWSE